MKEIKKKISTEELNKKKNIRKKIKKNKKIKKKKKKKRGGACQAVRPPQRGDWGRARPRTPLGKFPNVVWGGGLTDLSVVVSLCGAEDTTGHLL